MRGLAILGASVMLMANTAPGTSVGYMTASALADRCREDSNVSVSYCLAFIAGVRDTAKAFEIWNGQREFCMPVTTTQSELRDAFLRRTDHDLQARQGQAASVVLLAIKEAFPCAGS